MHEVVFLLREGEDESYHSAHQPTKHEDRVGPADVVHLCGDDLAVQFVETTTNKNEEKNLQRTRASNNS